MLTARSSAGQDLDVMYHVQQAVKSFWASKFILLDRGAWISDRLRYFDAVVSGVACFASGHRTIQSQKTVANNGCFFQKLCRHIVLPPLDGNWPLEWHEIVHVRNDRVRMFHCSGCSMHMQMYKVGL